MVTCAFEIDDSKHHGREESEGINTGNNNVMQAWSEGVFTENLGYKTFRVQYRINL